MNGITVSGASRIEQFIPYINSGDTVFVNVGMPDIDWAGIAAFPFLSHSGTCDFSPECCKESLGLLKRIGARPVVLRPYRLSASKCFDLVTEGMDASSRANVLRWLGGSPEPLLAICEKQAQAVVSAARSLRIPVRRA